MNKAKPIFWISLLFWLIAIAVLLVWQGLGKNEGADVDATYALLSQLCHKEDYAAVRTYYQSLPDADRERSAKILLQYQCLEKANIDAAGLYESLAPYIVRGNAEYGEKAKEYALHILSKGVEEADWKASARFACKHFSSLSEEEQEALVISMANGPHDVVLPCFLEHKTPKMMEFLESLTITTQNKQLLLSAFADFSDERKKALLQGVIEASWYMQPGGSVQLPQYLGLSLKRYSVAGFEDYLALVQVKQVGIEGKTLKRKGEPLHEVAFKLPVLDRSGSLFVKEDLTPYLKVANWHRVHADAELWLLGKATPTDCYANHSVQESEECMAHVLYRQDIRMDFKYRAFQGVVTGSPRTSKVEADNQRVAKQLRVELCSDQHCAVIWDRAAVKREESIPTDYSKGVTLKISAQSALEQVLASRVLARNTSDPSNTWHEVAAFYAHAPISTLIPLMVELDIARLCPQKGDCTLGLKLNPSLRMARRDPRITSYAGTQIDLGTVKLDVKTPVQQHIWLDFMQEVMAKNP